MVRNEIYYPWCELGVNCGMCAEWWSLIFSDITNKQGLMLVFPVYTFQMRDFNHDVI